MGFDHLSWVQWIEQLGPGGGVVFFCGGVLLISICIPKTLLSLAAGALYGTSYGFLMMLAVSVTAAALNYSFARWLVYDTALLWTSRHPKGESLRQVAASSRFMPLLLLRLSPVPTMLVSYGCGSLAVPMRPYLLASALAVVGQILWIRTGQVASDLAGSEAISVAGGLTLVVQIAASMGLAVYLARAARLRGFQ
jgi:uncharacterized membrane protein YdjX (TVP38/TMEM64 family)